MSLASHHVYLSRHFHGLSMPEQVFHEIEFEDCQFTDCHFSDSQFCRCRFIECRFTRCNLSLCQFPYSQFTEVSFTESKLIGIDWTRASWPRHVFHAPIGFYQCLLNDSSFFGLNLDELRIEACKAQDLDFREGHFCRANFRDTDLARSLFGNTHLIGADFTEACHYDIDPFNNRLNQAKFSRLEAIRLLYGMDIELVD